MLSVVTCSTSEVSVVKQDDLGKYLSIQRNANLRFRDDCSWSEAHNGTAQMSRRQGFAAR